MPGGVWPSFFQAPLGCVPRPSAGPVSTPQCSVVLRRKDPSDTTAIIELAEVELFDLAGNKIPGTSLTATLSTSMAVNPVRYCFDGGWWGQGIDVAPQHGLPAMRCIRGRGRGREGKGIASEA
jgi:hypothetical protein